MKNTIKNLYNINPKALIKYTDKVYKIKNEDESEYCLKYVDCPCNNMIVEKMNTLNLSENFEMPIKTCVRSNQFNYDNKVFYVILQVLKYSILILSLYFQLNHLPPIY